MWVSVVSLGFINGELEHGKETKQLSWSKGVDCCFTNYKDAFLKIIINKKSEN